ncbi:hypothetical protein B6U93_01515 [Candidatus Woesearchaeota archaeon ex4484_78]|nr:MAG: hypothetical protein B6U93_01515 [Candidatus Woesearchaeota archaeon ex4484_78]
MKEKENLAVLVLGIVGVIAVIAVVFLFVDNNRATGAYAQKIYGGARNADQPYIFFRQTRGVEKGIYEAHEGSGLIQVGITTKQALPERYSVERIPSYIKSRDSPVRIRKAQWEASRGNTV